MRFNKLLFYYFSFYSFNINVNGCITYCISDTSKTINKTEAVAKCNSQRGIYHFISIKENLMLTHINFETI